MINIHNRASYHITHIPTGIVVECSLYRSQHQNKNACVKLLKQKLWALENMTGYKEFTQCVEGEEVFSYTLPDGEEYLNEFGEYKEES